MYYIIGGVAYGILQFIISWVAGELDVDFDGDADFDIGDVVSFKGLIHFLMGFGGWTSIKQLLGYEITWVDWLIGFFIGLPFKKTFKEMFVEDKKDNPTEDNFEAVK